jgi:acid phosphatase family membrane protein YuiD
VLAKFVTELPLDAAFAAGFGALLHWRLGLNLARSALVGTLALTTACTAGLGLSIGALSASPDSALAVGVGVMVVYMVVGILNPAGAAAKPPSAAVTWLSQLPPSSDPDCLPHQILMASLIRS